MAKSKEYKLSQIHQDALYEFDNIQTALRDERLQCLQDRRFYSIAGSQWEGPLGDQFENKPRFEVNKIHLSVIRIINEYRNNRVTVDFISKDGTANEELADTCNGLYRSDEQDSVANEAYDNAFEEAVGGGFGAWRLRTCYEDEEDDEEGGPEGFEDFPMDEDDEEDGDEMDLAEFEDDEDMEYQRDLNGLPRPPRGMEDDDEEDEEIML